MSSDQFKRLWVVAVMGGLAGAAMLSMQTIAQDEPQRPRPQERRPIDLTDEEFEVLISIVGERQPAAADRLKALKESDPEQFRQTLRRLLDHERLRPLLAMKRNDPRGFELHLATIRAKARAGELRRQIAEAQATGSDADPLRLQLRQAAEQVVEAEFKTREHELAQLRKRLDRLEQDLADRRANRDKLVAQYYDRLSQPPRKDSKPPADPQ